MPISNAPATSTSTGRSKAERWRRFKNRGVFLLALAAVALPTLTMMSLHKSVIPDEAVADAEASLLQPSRGADKSVEESNIRRVEQVGTAGTIETTTTTTTTEEESTTKTERKPETVENPPQATDKVEIVNDQPPPSSTPLAKSLLNKPPPFQESDILRLSPNLTTSPNTVVTGYFRVSSKYPKSNYDDWMRNFLSLQDHMVIFTQPEMVDQVKELRSHALDRTVIIVMKLDDLPIGGVYPTEFWERQLLLDPERKRHKSYQLFWIWLSKSWCVTQAIRLNFFHSDLYVWSDIGCFRKKNYNSKTMIQHRDQVPPHEMIQMAHHIPNPPDEELFNDKYSQKQHFYHSGSQAAAYKDTWIQFHEYFLDTIDRFVAKDMLIVEDQAVLQSVCLSHPTICAYIPFTDVKDNHYFGLRYALHNGGERKLWRHPKALEITGNNNSNNKATQ